MSFTTTAMFPGLLFDTATRFAADQPTWATARELGWDALLVPEPLGGAGGTLHDLGAIAEALGARGLALPTAERCGAAPMLLIEASPSNGAARELAQGLASQTVQPAWLQPDARAGGQLVAEDLPATHYLAVATDGRLVAFTAEQMPAALARTRGVDGVTRAAWSPASLPWTQGVPLSDAPAVADAATLSTLVGCIQSVAAIGALIEQTATHLNQRSQFGVLLSSFQALRHKLVDMYVKYEASRGLVLDCVDRAAHDLAAVRRDVQLAHFYLSDAGRFAGEAAIQLHGAIGMSEELPVARLYKRLLANEFRHGDGLLQARRLTDALRPTALPAA